MSNNISAPLCIALLEALAEAWLTTEDALQIGNDPSKIRLMRRVATEMPSAGEHMSPSLHELYEVVFLQNFSKLVASTRV